MNPAARDVLDRIHAAGGELFRSAIDGKLYWAHAPAFDTEMLNAAAGERYAELVEALTPSRCVVCERRPVPIEGLACWRCNPRSESRGAKTIAGYTLGATVAHGVYVDGMALCGIDWFHASRRTWPSLAELPGWRLCQRCRNELELWHMLRVVQARQSSRRTA